MKQKRKTVQLVAAVSWLALLGFGCAPQQNVSTPKSQPPAKTEQQAEQLVIKGKVAGKSNKAKTISVRVGKGEKAKNEMLRFDDATQGVQFLTKNTAVIITYEMRDKAKYALSVKPKLAKLPEGVTRIDVETMEEVINSGEPLFLVDSRPTSRWDQSHLPGAVSIPVPKIKKKKQAVLPTDKSIPIVFYCGGPT
ncbi:MAG: hypothetical protein CSA34_04135 [Desulfobulbus propionicus]|nr:MAG: hypothetical protein CSA34_04135 [Desulfobulbus propionicus]